MEVYLKWARGLKIAAIGLSALNIVLTVYLLAAGQYADLLYSICVLALAVFLWQQSKSMKATYERNPGGVLEDYYDAINEARLEEKRRKDC